MLNCLNLKIVGEFYTCSTLRHCFYHNWLIVPLSFPLSPQKDIGKPLNLSGLGTSMVSKSVSNQFNYAISPSGKMIFLSLMQSAV